MKRINIYSLRKKLLFILWLFVIVLFIVDFSEQNWSDPKWAGLISASLNVVALGFILNSSYKNTRIELYPDKIVYRLSGQKEDEIIPISKETTISKDWKGIYVSTNNERATISMNYLMQKEVDRIFSSIKNYYDSK